MTEKDIENLIARHPESFFPGEGFALVGQQVQLGRCRVDLIFKDRLKRSIIVEVKKGILSREASGQIIEYYGLLKQEKPNEIIELILCANTIPVERRAFLEGVGIECKEIGVALVAQLAQECQYEFSDSVKKENQNEALKRTGTIRSTAVLSSHGNVWIFQANPRRFDILNALADPQLKCQKWLVNDRYRAKIKHGDTALIWMSGKEAGIYALAKIVSDPEEMVDFPEEEKYWVEEADRGKKTLKVLIDIQKDFTNAPLFRTQIKSIPELSNLSILKFSQGTNFPVTQEEWVIIKKFLEESRV